MQQKGILFTVLLVLESLLGSAQTMPVANARILPAGSLVKVAGLVTNGPELGSIRYLQDSTAGIAAYPGTGSVPGFESSVTLGDSIEISGYLTNYNGLLEITPILSFKVLAHSRPLPAPKNVLLEGLNESLEGQLVRVPCVTFQGPGALFNGSGVYTVQDPGGAAAGVYFRNGHPLVGTAKPGAPVQLVAILSQYGDYQLLPRTTSDFSAASCFYLLQPPVQSDITNSGFTIRWKTNLPSSASIFYGTSPDAAEKWPVSGISTDHGAELTGLEPGSIYWIRIRAVHNSDTIYSASTPFATKSLSSGEIKVYFNQGIDLATANGLQADGNTFAEVLAETLTRINSAQQTIDVAMYNTNRNDLVNALEQARLRGVRVRYIAAAATENQALSPMPGFPVLYGNSNALMHNKFMVIDANDAPGAWVMSGSLNWTSVNMTQDYNNTLFIQDQSLARTYELEFNEMWGGNGAFPNSANSRFGDAKADNTPHHFVIGSTAVECWFSPTDQVTSRVVQTIVSAQDNLDFAIFSFTKDEIGNAFIQAYQDGAGVRGLVENINDPGAEFGWLVANGLSVADHPAKSAMHHKYAVADAGSPGSDPVVLTGSHNWTQAAESSNDENTLVLHHPDLAVLYHAEFERRWMERTTSAGSADTRELDIFPNPANDLLFVRSTGFPTSTRWLRVWDVYGRLCLEMELPKQQQISTVPVGGLPAGVYRANIQTDRGAITFSFQTLRR